jgi:hypothetical protein
LNTHFIARFKLELSSNKHYCKRISLKILKFNSVHQLDYNLVKGMCKEKICKYLFQKKGKKKKKKKIPDMIDIATPPNLCESH